VIVYTGHPRDQMNKRGIEEIEVEQVLEDGKPADARKPRLAKERVFDEGYLWKGASYPHKLIRVIYVEEDTDIVIITAKSYYGSWEAVS
jgi:hypothetical protein